VKRAGTIVAALLLTVFVRASVPTPPPVYSHDMGITCLDTGCVPFFDGVFDEDPITPGTQLGGPSYWSKEYTRVESGGWKPVPVRGDWSYEAYFSPNVNFWQPSEGEVPGDVCGGAGSIIACMCSYLSLAVGLRVTYRDGSVWFEVVSTPEMSGVDVAPVVFNVPPGFIRHAEMRLDSIARLHFFGENLQPFAQLQYVGCHRGIARIRPAPLPPRP